MPPPLATFVTSHCFVSVHGPEPGDQHPTARATLVRYARDISGGVPRRLDKGGRQKYI